ncbi:hypothetical protein HXX76_006516 [Chlamydomonas incerta]|uniref:Uncharacterized protein n=1 Tax=Chlamydomonas incerta TaxID=51695 RepID=A0A835T9D9_CHLIN|nr:hypothetical protein HXX76_006516 [Chlamydomonas incerta]|eukprot:KAG2436204.1 hypothetical protein HXX76_006516 [Chlamydomonas incerta]
MGGCLSADVVVDHGKLEELRKQSSLAQRQGSVSSSRPSRRSSGGRPHRSHDGGGSDGEPGGRRLSPAGPSRVVLMDGDDDDGAAAAAAAAEEDVMYLIKKNGGSVTDANHNNNRYGSGAGGVGGSGGWVQVPPHNAEAEAAARLGLVAGGSSTGVGAQGHAGGVSPASARADIPACRALSHSSASGGGRAIHGSFSGGRYAGAAPDAALAARPVAGGSGSGAALERRRRCSVGEEAAGGAPATMFKATSSFSSRHRRGSNDPLGAALLIMRGAGGNPAYSDSRPRMGNNSASGGAAGNSMGGAAAQRPPRYSSLQQQPSLHGYGAAPDTARPERQPQSQRGEAGQGPRRTDVPVVRQLQRGGVGERQWQSFSAYGDAAAVRNAGARAPLSSNSQVPALGGGGGGSRRRESESDIEVAVNRPAGVHVGLAVGGLTPLSSDSEGEAEGSGTNAGAPSGSESGSSSAALRRSPLAPRAAALAGGASRNANSLPGAVQDGSNAPLELLDAAAVRAQRQRHAKGDPATGGAPASSERGQRPHGHLADEVWRTEDGEQSVRHRGDAGDARGGAGEGGEARRRTSSQLSDDDEEIAAIARAAANELAKNRSYRHTGDVFDEHEDESATDLIEPGSGSTHRVRRGSVEEQRRQRHVFSEREQRRTQRDRRDRQDEDEEAQEREREREGEEREPRRPVRHVIRPHANEAREEADGGGSFKSRNRRQSREEQRRREKEEAEEEEEWERRRQEERERAEAEVLEAVSRTASQRWQTARTLQPSRSILKKPLSVNRRASEAAGGGTDTEPGSSPGAVSDSHVASISLDGGALQRTGGKSRLAPGEAAAARASSYAAWDQDSSGHGPASGAAESTAVEALGGNTDSERGRSIEPGGGGSKRPRSLSKNVSFRGVDGDGGNQDETHRSKPAAKLLKPMEEEEEEEEEEVQEEQRP